jgi:16S rRNA (guanine527-N7)-methyltransferase
VPESQELVQALALRYELSRTAVDALATFAAMVADPGEDGIAERQASDSLLANRLANSIAALELERVGRARRMADIGSGLGFPGLVLAAALPETTVVLVEKEPRRCDFLRSALDAMRLTNVEVVEQHVQRWSEAAGFDLVTARSVARPRMVVSFAAPLLVVGGAVVIWGNPKRDPVKDAEAVAAAAPLGLRLAEVALTAPVGAAPRHLYVYEKVAPTPESHAPMMKIPHPSSTRRERKRARAADVAESHTKALERLEAARDRLRALETGDERSREELERVRTVIRKVERRVEVLERRRQRAERKLPQAMSDQLP